MTFDKPVNEPILFIESETLRLLRMLFRPLFDDEGYLTSKKVIAIMLSSLVLLNNDYLILQV